MQFHLVLAALSKGSFIPINNSYAISAVIFKVLHKADSDYAAFLHNKGYTQKDSLKSFKLFTFSDLKTPFQIRGDRLLLLTGQAELVVSFHLPQAAETFIKGLFIQQQIEIADRKSRAAFTITRVEALPLPLTNDAIQELVLQPRSPMVCGLKNERGNYSFLPPEHPEFIPQLMYNWKEKYKAQSGTEAAETAFAESAMEVIFYSNPPRSRLITIKADTPAETKIRGFVNFRLRVKGKREALELLLNSGAGVYNSLGMGSLEVEKQETGAG